MTEKSCSYCIAKDLEECGGTEADRKYAGCSEEATPEQIEAYEKERRRLLESAFRHFGCYDIRFG